MAAVNGGSASVSSDGRSACEHGEPVVRVRVGPAVAGEVLGAGRDAGGLVADDEGLGVAGHECRRQCRRNACR